MTRLRTALDETFRSLRVRNFRLFFTGQLISQVGNWLTLVAQTLLVLKLTDNGVALGALAAARSSDRCCCSDRGPDSSPTAATSGGCC